MSRYRLNECLGRGGMGEVWLGTRRLFDGSEQTVAFKSVIDLLVDDPGALVRLKREAQACMMLRHEHIVQVYDMDTVDGRPWMIMEYIDGVTLRQLTAHAKLSSEIVRRIFIDVLEALRHAHDRGVLHRDISLNNIMITRSGKAMLMDFGLARILEHGSTSGNFKGTLAFMAPEVFSEQRWSRGSDVYSLAGVMYQVISGELPLGVVGLPEGVPTDLSRFITSGLGPARTRTDQDIAHVCEQLLETEEPLASRDELGALVERAMRGHESSKSLDSATTIELHKTSDGARENGPAQAPRRRRPTARAMAVGLGLAAGLASGLFALDRDHAGDGPATVDAVIEHAHPPTEPAGESPTESVTRPDSDEVVDMVTATHANSRPPEAERALSVDMALERAARRHRTRARRAPVSSKRGREYASMKRMLFPGL